MAVVFYRMSDTPPKVSVIVPAYNNADYTVETVESILQQTYTDFELLVVDDGSTDHTRAALEHYGDRLQYIYKENGGACSARNMGVEIARGEYIACLDCDDLWMEDKLELSVAALDCNPDAGFVFTGCRLIDAEGIDIDEIQNLCSVDGDIFTNIILGGATPSPTVVMRKSHLERVGLFDENIFIPADLDLWLRLANWSAVCRVEKALSRYRVASNFTLRNIKLSIEEHLYVLEKNNAAFTRRSPELKNLAKRRFLYMHAIMYRNIGDCGNARTLLKQAIDECAADRSIRLNYILSLLGLRVWNFASAIGDFMRGKAGKNTGQ